MEMDDFLKAGSDIMKDVSRAVESGDYSNLSGSIRDRVTQVTDQLGEDVAQGARNFAEAVTTGKVSGTSSAGTDRKTTGAAGKDGAKKGRNYFLQRRPGRSSGSGKKIAGILLAILPGGMTAVWLLAALLMAVTGEGSGALGGLVLALFSGVITMACALLARSGSKEQKLVSRYYQYGELIGKNREYFSVAELAQKAGVSGEEVCDDILRMRAAGYLPYAVLDRNKTTVILTDRMYKEYANAEKARQEREEAERIRAMQNASAPQGQAESWESAEKNVAEAEARAHAERKENPAAGADAAGMSRGTQEAKGTAQGRYSAEQAALLEEGQSYIVQIRAINDRIPDTEEMSDKLYQLEDIMRRIFAQVKKNPSKAKDLRRLMNYYLPTTTKLLGAYADLNEQPEAGENIRETKRQIEDSMDIINHAFGKLLDDMFQEQAWDLSSDLNVMKTMMAQDGLTEGDSAWNAKAGTSPAGETTDGQAAGAGEQKDADDAAKEAEEAFVMNGEGGKIPLSEAENL